MRYPQNRDELEEMFAGDDEPSFTRAEMANFLSRYMGQNPHASHMRKSEMILFLKNSDLRPTILWEVEIRMDEARTRRAARRQATVDGLNRRRGKWRFSAVARLPRGDYVDDITGIAMSAGIVVRDGRTKETLTVAKTTATAMKQRRQMATFDMRRLPIAGDSADTLDSLDIEIPTFDPPTRVADVDVEDLLAHLFPE